MAAILRRPWTIAASVVAAVLYAVACSDAVYELTSPSAFELHVWLRKIYSVGAFALVGYLYRRGRVEAGASSFVTSTIAAVAAYSAAIEVGQFIGGSKEGLLWNAFDVACGAVGGPLTETSGPFERVRAQCQLMFAVCAWMSTEMSACWNERVNAKPLRVASPFGAPSGFSNSAYHAGSTVALSSCKMYVPPRLLYPQLY